MTERLLPLARASRDNIAAVGSKAAHLGELIAAGLAVPVGYVLTTEAFDAQFPDGQFGAESQANRDERLATGLDRSLLAPLQAAFDTLTAGAEHPVVVVRSSATAEDGAERSYAGQHATYYYVARERLASAVIDCWRSLWSERALAYRAQTNTAEASKMAVIIQRMVHAEVAGVAFTQDPNGSDDIAIESSWGLGASVVDGRVTPDRFRVSPRGAITERRIARKRYKVTEDLINPEGSRLDPIPGRMQLKPSLSEGQLLEVAHAAECCADHFGAPQDVEWAYEAGELLLLQSRHVTTVALDEKVVEGKWIAFKPILENFETPVTPLTGDLVRRILPGFGRFINGRFYISAATLSRLLPIKADDRTLAEIALMKRHPGELTIDWRRVPLTLLIVLAAYLFTGVFAARTRRLPLSALDDYPAYLEGVVAREPDALSLMRRLFQGPSPVAPVHQHIFQANISAARYFVLFALLKNIVKRYAPDIDDATLGAVCTGERAMWSTRMVADLTDVAREADAHPQIRSLFLDNEPEVLHRVITEHADSPFLAAFSRFVDTYGHRCTKEVELTSPRWFEDPTPLISMIRNYLRAGVPDNDPYANHLVARDRLNQALPNRFVRRVVRTLTERVRFFAALRENTRHHHARVFAVVRSKILLHEQALIADGALHCPDDIFFLHWDEIESLLRGATTWRDVDDVVRRRRVHHEREATRRAPRWFNLDIPPTPADTMLRGQTACPGHAMGRAKLITDPTVDADLEPGDILVAPYTDPAWTPLFPAAAAVVVEIGSYLSHAGTVARELQIPCVVDVEGCMQTIKSGDLIRVDASAGRVEVVEE